LGYNIIDTSGPAVSNQWILNKALLKLLTIPDINTVVLQLTSTGKLDVEVDPDRLQNIVINDSLRNFVISSDRTVTKIDHDSISQVAVGSVWPSSVSQDHPAKQHWLRYLYSVGLELEDIFCKLILFKQYCDSRNIDLLVFQGYDLSWSQQQRDGLKGIIKNLDSSFFNQYQQSRFWHLHDHTEQNKVPCFAYQVHMVQQIAQHMHMNPAIHDRLCSIVARYQYEP
jgi:hypothetical protein